MGKCKKEKLNSSYRKYLDETPTSSHSEEVLHLIKQIEDGQKDKELEKLLWEKAKSENTLLVYRHYLEKYPEGSHKEEAESAIKQIAATRNHVNAKADNKDNTGQESPKRSNTKKYLFISAGVVLVAIAAWWATNQYPKPNPDPIRNHISPVDSLVKRSNQDAINQAVLEKNKTDSMVRVFAKIKQDSISRRDSIGIGKYFRGGIIIDIDNTGEHGLLVAKSDLNGGNECLWDNAKKLCADFTAEGNNNWHLPSVDELQIMYNYCLRSGIPGLNRNKLYWSSTLTNDTYARCIKFFHGSTSYNYNTSSGQNHQFFVRAVSKF